jgi:hypothetical protein
MCGTAVFNDTLVGPLPPGMAEGFKGSTLSRWSNESSCMAVCHEAFKGGCSGCCCSGALWEHFRLHVGGWLVRGLLWRRPRLLLLLLLCLVLPGLLLQPLQLLGVGLESPVQLQQLGKLPLVDGCRGVLVQRPAPHRSGVSTTKEHPPTAGCQEVHHSCPREVTSHARFEGPVVCKRSCFSTRPAH